LKAEEDMQQSSDLFFVSSNRHKYQEAKKILQSFGINLKFFKYELEEIQSSSLKEIASKKAIQAFQKCKKPIIIEDDGLFINSLGGFPGPYSSFVFKTIGNNGILQLLK
jgi:XTP/dITP diphosphohydrolase